MHGSPMRIHILKFKIKRLEKELRDARKAVRIAKRADWMVTCDWVPGEKRDRMWERVKKLAGIARWSYTPSSIS